MTNPLTREDRDRLAALHAEAEITLPLAQVCWGSDIRDDTNTLVAMTSPVLKQSRKIGALIVAAVNAAPVLLRALAEADRLTEENARLTRERDEARAYASLGCDSNGGGHHTLIKQGSYTFCGACGHSIKTPTLHDRARKAEARAEASEARVAVLEEALSGRIAERPKHNPNIGDARDQEMLAWLKAVARGGTPDVG